jgi:hypothetical protein
MREFRSCGSVRGAPGNRRSYRDLPIPPRFGGRRSRANKSNGRQRRHFSPDEKADIVRFLSSSDSCDNLTLLSVRVTAEEHAFTGVRQQALRARRSGNRLEPLL